MSILGPLQSLLYSNAYIPHPSAQDAPVGLHLSTKPQSLCVWQSPSGFSLEFWACICLAHRLPASQAPCPFPAALGSRSPPRLCTRFFSSTCPEHLWLPPFQGGRPHNLKSHHFPCGAVTGPLFSRRLLSSDKLYKVPFTSLFCSIPELGAELR